MQLTNDEPACYRIIRFYRDPRKTSRTVRVGLTLEQAQKHCSSPATHSKGIWFDGYDLMKGIKHNDD